MFDPHHHRLEVLYIALRRWQDELAKIDVEPCVILRAKRWVEARAMISRIEREMDIASTIWYIFRNTGP